MIQRKRLFLKKSQYSSFSLTEIMEDKKEKFNTTNVLEKKSKSFTEQEIKYLERLF